MPNGEFKPNPEWISWRYLAKDPTERFTLYGRKEDILKLEKVLSKTTVFCVMKGVFSLPYDLQFISTEESLAREFADQLMKALHEARPHGDSKRDDEDWIPLSTGSHWFLKATGTVMRVSSVELNVPRAQQPGDPEELRDEIRRILDANDSSRQSDT